VRNALTGNTAVQEFVDLCESVAHDASVRVVVITGDPVFSSGGNVKDMRRRCRGTGQQLTRIRVKGCGEPFDRDPLR
jgi:enoyl-CoA hydratase/carnithine racemase